MKYDTERLQMNNSVSLMENSKSVTTLWLSPTSQMSPQPWNILETKGKTYINASASLFYQNQEWRNF